MIKRKKFQVLPKTQPKKEDLGPLVNGSVCRYVKNTLGRVVKVKVYIVPKLGKAFSVNTPRARICSIYDVRELHETHEAALVGEGVKTPIWFWTGYDDKTLNEGFKVIKNGQEVFLSETRHYGSEVFSSKLEAYEYLIKNIQKEIKESSEKLKKEEKDLVLAKKLRDKEFFDQNVSLAKKSSSGRKKVASK